MADRFVLSHLKRLPLFAALSPEQLEVIANAVQVQRFEPREAVFVQGQPAGGLTIFVSGQGVLTQVGPDNVERPVGAVNGGEYLNESGLFQDVVAPVTLRVRETSIVLFLSRQQFNGVVSYRPDIASLIQSRAVAPAPAHNFPAAPASAAPVTAAPAVAPPPEHVFEGQRENETVIVETRRHWWAFARRIWLVVIILVALLVFISTLRDATLVALTFPLFLVGAGICLFFYLEWRNDAFIVTDQRIVNIRREIISFSTHFNEIPIQGIHEINVVLPVTDPMARLFHYGTLTVKTSGDIINLVVDFMPHAKQIQDTIFAQQKTIKARQEEQARSLTRNAIRSDIDKFLGRDPAGGGSNPAQNPSQIVPMPSFLSTRFLGEKGETVYRKHWIVWLQHVLVPGVVTLAGLALIVAGFFGAAASPNIGFVGVALAIAVTLFGVIWLYLADWDWRNDLYILGDQTVTLIHKRPLWLQNQKDQILLSQIDNVISETSGFLNNMFNVGNVGLLLTGADVKDAKWFRSVHHPQSIQQEVSRRQEQARFRRQEEDAQRERQQIVEYLSVYHESMGGAPPAPSAQSAQQSGPSPDQPPRVRDRSRPPGIPLVRRDNPPEG